MAVGKPERPRWQALRSGLHRLEDGLLGGLMLLLAALASVQILRRSLFNDGWMHSDALARSLVLWIALLGALGAVRQHRHVAIDLLPWLRSPSLRRLLHGLGQLFAAGFCVAMASVGHDLYRLEVETGNSLLPGLPMAWVVLPIPLGFLLMAVRFLVASLLPPPTPGVEVDP